MDRLECLGRQALSGSRLYSFLAHQFMFAKIRAFFMFGWEKNTMKWLRGSEQLTMQVTSTAFTLRLRLHYKCAVVRWR